MSTTDSDLDFLIDEFASANQEIEKYGETAFYQYEWLLRYMLKHHAADGIEAMISEFAANFRNGEVSVRDL